MRVAGGVVAVAGCMQGLQIVVTGVVRSRLGCDHLFVTVVVLMLWLRLMLRLVLWGHATGQQWRQYPCSHGGAGESPKDQYHHQEEIEPATHR